MRRGWGLIQMIAAIGISAMVLSVVVPLFLAAQKQADLGVRRAMVTAMARELESHFRQDVREATSVKISTDGGELALGLSRVSRPEVTDRVVYRRAGTGLERVVLPGAAGRPAERFLYSAPLADFQFRRKGRAFEASLRFVTAGLSRGSKPEQRLVCSATPGSDF